MARKAKSIRPLETIVAPASRMSLNEAISRFFRSLSEIPIWGQPKIRWAVARSAAGMGLLAI